MTDDSPNANLPAQTQFDQSPPSESNAAAEIAQLKRELEIVKNANPFRMAEIAIELQIERLRVMEISRARDSALQRLSECCAVICHKNDLIERMQEDGRNNVTTDVVHRLHQVGGNDAEVEQLKAHICNLETSNEELRLMVAQLRASAAVDLPPCYEANESKVTSVEAAVQTDAKEHQTTDTNIVSPASFHDQMKYVSPNTDDPKVLLNARNAFLASIPLPEDAPDATLSAFVIPPPFTIHDFLGSAPSSLRAALGNHKILYSTTTYWCPDREENGYMYCPVFKCSTNPRIATAHRWVATDVIEGMDEPTECFYKKDGVWYYAGSYKALRMDELSIGEWAQLPAETVSAIVKETLAGRKHICPQNTYETTQLYAAGALKVVCVALLCVGFNQEVYESILEYSVKFSESKWKALANANARVLAGMQGSPNISSKENGNMPPPATSAGPGPMVNTPIMQTHFPRTPSLLSNPSPTNGSPPRRGAHIELQRYCASPPLGLGFGSSTWGMASNGRVNSVISLAHDFESMELPTEYPKGEVYKAESRQ